MAAEATLYSTRDVARIFGLQESRLLYWAKTGVVGPSVRKSGRGFYTFQDLITVKSAKELIEGGLSLQAVRKNLQALRSALPGVDRPLARLRVVSDGERLVVVGEEVAFEPLSGQLVMDFAVGALETRVAEVMELPARPPSATGEEGQGGLGATEVRSAYGWFLRGCDLDAGPEDAEAAAEAYRRAIELDPTLAAAYTNLGNLEHRRGRRGEARGHYERALQLDPEQPEARYNLANLLDELGESDEAIAQWTRTVAAAPDFADAHFNLGAALLRAGEDDAGRVHLRRYLRLAGDGGEWSERARELLAQLEDGAG